MVRNLFLPLILLAALVVACKTQKTDDQILAEAGKVQQEALVIGASVDTMLESRFKQGAFMQDIKKLQGLRQAADLWARKRTDIPGSDHDHSDHHDHEHGHMDGEGGSQHSALDILKLQQDWKSEIEAIRDSLQ